MDNEIFVAPIVELGTGFGSVTFKGSEESFPSEKCFEENREGFLCHFLEEALEKAGIQCDMSLMNVSFRITKTEPFDIYPAQEALSRYQARR